MFYTARMHCAAKISCALRRQFFAFLAVFLGIVAFGASPAAAHNDLTESTPENGAVLETSPTTWALTFSKDVPLDSASAEVVAASGIRTPLSAPTHGVSKKQVVFTLPDGLTGNVTGRWRLVGSDGHVVSARVSFSVVASTAPQGGETSSVTTTTLAVPTTLPTAFVDNSTPGVVRFSLRLFGYIAILLFGGLLFAETYLAKGVLRAPRAMATLTGSSTFLVAVPFVQALIFLDESKDVGVIGALGHLTSLLDTSAGSMMLLRACAGLVLLGLILRVFRGQTEFASPFIFLASGVYLVALVWVGHSRSMAWPVLGVPTGVLHNVSIAVWLGGLAVFVLFVLPVVPINEGFDAFRRFGDAAQVAVIGMVVTGIIQTVRLHGNFITLLSEGHGRWLLLKIVLVGIMLKIGDINRRRLMKKLPQSDIVLEKRLSLLRRASLTEIVNGGIVTAVSTVLVTASFG